MDSPLERILSSKSKIKPVVALEAVKKTWSFVTIILPVQHLSLVAGALAEFFQQEEKKHEQ